MVLFGDPRLPPAFWAKVSPEPEDGCWRWTACRNAAGYGRFGVPLEYRTELAHRYMMERVAGHAGELYVCHRCDNPACVNPAHLFLGDNQANVTDMVNKGRHRSGPPFVANRQKTHCHRGHSLADARLYRGSRVCRACCAENRRIQRRKARGIAA